MGDLPSRLRLMSSFLRGEIEFKGAWFGDNAHGECGKFWWRKYLPLTEAADEIAALRERVADTEGVLKAIRALIGNVDHLRGHGSNAAEMRGGMLNDIRDLTDAALSRPNDGGER